MTDLSKLANYLSINYTDAQEIANAVQDDLEERLNTYPGEMSNTFSISRAAYDVVMEAFGFGDEEDED